MVQTANSVKIKVTPLGAVSVIVFGACALIGANTILTRVINKINS